MKAWQLHAQIGGDPQRNCPSPDQIVFEAGEQLVECTQAPGKENVKVSRLRCPGPVTGVWGQHVAF